MMIRSRKILDSAKGAPCSIRLPGICNGNAETTVWCHLNGHRFGKGGAIKAHDIHGFHGCADCHRYYDVGHGTRPLMGDLELLEQVLGAVCETWVRLIAAGIVIVPLDVEKPAHERPIPARKAKEQRAPIQQRKADWPKGRKMQSANTLRRKERT
jgi:hypothetical protein